MIRKKKRGLEIVVIVMVIVAGGLLFTSCNEKICPAYSLKSEDLNLNKIYGSRYIQSPITDQVNISDKEKQSYPEQAFVR